MTRPREFFVLLAVTTALLLARPAKDRTPKFDEDRFFSFVDDVDKFTRDYNGCPAKGYPPEIECFKGAAKFDLARWNRIVDKGRKLFNVR